MCSWILSLLLAIPITYAQLEICVPPLNTGAPVTGKYSGVSTDMRIIVLVGRGSEELFDRTCGINNHDDCPDAVDMAGWAIGPTGLFSLPVIEADDADLPYVIVLVVPDMFVSMFSPNPLGRGGMPAFLSSLAVAQKSETRTSDWTGNACGSISRPSSQASMLPSSIPLTQPPPIVSISASRSPIPMTWTEEEEEFPSMTPRPSRTPSRTPSPWWQEAEEEARVTPRSALLRQQSSATEITMALSVAVVALFAGVAFLTN